MCIVFDKHGFVTFSGGRIVVQLISHETRWGRWWNEGPPFCHQVCVKTVQLIVMSFQPPMVTLNRYDIDDFFAGLRNPVRLPLAIVTQIQIAY